MVVKQQRLPRRTHCVPLRLLVLRRHADARDNATKLRTGQRKQRAVLTRNEPTTMTTSAEFTRSSTRGGLQKQRLVKAAAKTTAATACGAPAASPTILPAFAMSATPAQRCNRLLNL